MLKRMLPLDRYRVVDFGWVWAGAIPGQVLADLGAEVIKVESRKRLDYMRQGKPIVGDKPDPEQNPMFHNTNRNKLSLTVDLTSTDGINLLRELVCVSDVVIENFTPDVMSKVGLGYPGLRCLRPDLVMLSMSPAGETGPLRDLRSYAPTIAALSGLDSLVGYSNERALGMRHPLPDVNAGLLGVFAVLAALAYRQETGRGQHIDLSQWEAAVSVLGEPLLEYQMTGRIPGPQGNRDPGMAPHGIYPCVGEDAWVAIGVRSDEEWQGLCHAFGHPEWLQDRRFRDQYSRLSHREELDGMLATTTSRLTSREAAAKLQQAGVAAVPVLSPEERLRDPHFRERNVHVDIDHPVVGREVIFGLPWKMSRTPGSIRRRAPLLGEHNVYVLCEILGQSQDRVLRLTEQDTLQ